MATKMIFSGGGALEVKEDPEAVLTHLRESGQQPFALTPYRGNGRVWVNPMAIAYWEPRPDRSGNAHFV